MADLSPSLSGGLLPRLGQQPALPDGFRGWISSRLYHVQHLDSTGGFELEVTDLATLIRYLNFDFERFSLSSRESYSVANTEKAGYNLPGWPLLKLYYSAFFAAHAIMRSQGSGVVKLESPHAQHINSIVQIIDPSNAGIKPGMYLYEIRNSDNTGLLSAIMRPMPQDGGVHEVYWKAFCSFLQMSANRALLEKKANATEFSAGVLELTDAIRNGGGAVWFSSIRNELNYQHKHGAWFPIRKNAKSLKALDKLDYSPSSTFRMDISKKRDSLAAFSNVSCYLACLNIEVSDFVAGRSTVGHAFGQKWRRLGQQF